MTYRALTIALALSAAASSGCQRVSAAQPVPVAERTLHPRLAKVQGRAIPRTLSLTGSLVAERESNVAPDVAGKVVETRVERGQLVAKGAPLARIDVRGAALAASEARAGREAAHAQERLAEIECARSDRLLQQGAITPAQHERDRAGCEATLWSARAAEARARAAQKIVGDGVVRAPFAGLVAERTVSAGEWVGPGSRIVTLLAVDRLRLELTVPEADVRAVREGQAVKFEVAARPGEPFAGFIRYIGPAVRRTSRDLVVEAVVDNRDGRLRPGLFVRAQVDVGATTLPVVPASAVRRDGDSARLFVASGGRLEERLVELGPPDPSGEVVSIAHGLAVGEQVVAQDEPALQDGARVE